MDAEIQALLDKQAINEVIQRVGRTLDWLDEEGQASCYWPDAEIDFGFYEGNAEGFIPFLMKNERAARKRWHLMSQASIKLDGDRAEVECYGITTATVGSDPSRMFGGRYLDEFEKREGVWRIAKRTYILDWMRPFDDQSDFAKIGRGGLNVPDISQPGHPLYRVI